MKTALFDHLSALSEPLRVRLLHVLSAEELGVGELSRVLQTPQSTVSRHLKVLLTRGWVQRRQVGTAHYLSLADPLPEDAAPLWEVVARDLSELYEEDLRRVATVLAQRETDARGFFGRHADQWESLRQELFGSGHLLPTLTALLSPRLVVADLGCGTGEVLAALAPAVERVIGVDQEEAMLAAAGRRTDGMDNVSLVQSGLEALNLSADSVDAALCMLVLHHVTEIPQAFAEAARVLRPGGRLVVLDMEEHDRAEYRRTMGHVHLGFSAEALCAVAAESKLQCVSWRRLPPAPEAQGPGLFLAVFSA